MLCWVAVLASDAAVAEVQQSLLATPDYATQIGPLLTKYCGGCHQGEEAEGQLSMESYDQLLRGGGHGPVVTPGSAASSRLVGVLTGRVKPRMPPEGEPGPSAEEVEQLVAWIDAGALGPAGTRLKRHQLNAPHLAPAAAPAPVTAVAISPDGQRLAVAHFGVVELQTMERLATSGSPRVVTRYRLKHPGKVLAVAFTPQGKSLVAASGIAGLFGEARLWNCADGKRIRAFPGDPQKDQTQNQAESQHDLLYAAVVSPDGRMLATSGYDHKICLWDLASGKWLRSLSGHHGAIFDLAFTPDSRRLASASADATVKLWQVRTGDRLDTRSEPLKGQTTTAISPDGRLLVAGGEDSRIRVWRLLARDKPRNSPLLYSRFAHEGTVNLLRFSADGRWLVSAGADGEVKLWDADTFRQVHVWHHRPGTVRALAISAEAGMVVVGRMDGSLRFYSLAGFGKTTSKDKRNISEENAARKIQARRNDLRKPALPSASRPAAAGNSPPQAFARAAVPNERLEQEPNDKPGQAIPVQAPVRVRGAIAAVGADASQTAGADRRSDVDIFRFHCRRGASWIVTVRAQGNPGLLDSHVEVLDDQGRSIPRVMLQAVRDSYFAFRGKDSTQTNDFRLYQWEEMRLNEYLYCNGEVVRLYDYPRGPDSGFNVYPAFGQRHGFFGTTPITHALGEPCYIVVPHPPGSPITPGGLPTFVVNYENDDQSQREWGSDSYLAFTAPRTGDYLVRVSDVRGQQGADYRYELTIRPPRPDFKIRSVVRENNEISRGRGCKFGVEIARIDGFSGPVTVRFSGLPAGYSIHSPLVVPAGQLRAWGVLRVAPDAADLSAQNDSGIRLVASARLAGHKIRKWPVPFGKLVLKPTSKLQVDLAPGPSTGPPMERLPTEEVLPVVEIVPGTTRTLEVRVVRNGFEGPVSFGKQDATRNAPHGVYVDNIGLNGVLIPPDKQQRTIYLSAEPWVEPQQRIIFVEAEQAGRPTSNPVLLRVLRGKP